MPGSTAGGWPYLLPSDHPLEYPAYTQQLAALVESGFRGNWTPALGWSALVGTGLLVTRLGPLVVVEGILTRATSLALSAAVSVGTLPVGFRPSQLASSLQHLSLTNTSRVPAEVGFAANGDITMQPHTAGTLTTTGYLSINATFRGA